MMMTNQNLSISKLAQYLKGNKMIRSQSIYEYFVQVV